MGNHINESKTMNEGLSIFQEFLTWYSYGEEKDIKRWKGWIQKMMWSRQDGSCWFEEYDEFIEKHNLQIIFYRTFYTDAISALKKSKPKKRKLPKTSHLKRFKMKTAALFKRDLK